MQSMFLDQLQCEPSISRIYTSSFDGQSIYKAAQTQNSAFYEEGIEYFYKFISYSSVLKRMINDALNKF